MMTLAGRPLREWLEAGVLFPVFLALLLWSVPREGWIQASGFLLLGALLIYGFFFSPHLIQESRARASRTEAFWMLVWSMTVVWGVLPLGPLGKQVGEVLIGLTVIYILFVSPHRHGDTLEDRGIGSLSGFMTCLRSGEGRTLARFLFIGGNLGLLLCFFFSAGLLPDIIAGALRKMGGFRLSFDPPPWVWLAASIGLYNFLLCIIARWDNLSKAGPMILTYLIIGWTFVLIAGYWYIYVKNGGWVEFVPARGFKRISSYIIWGTLQELLFLSYFNTRIRKGVSSPLLAALLTAVIFAVFHLRAYTLMVICYLVGIVWALMFQTAPNLLLMGLSHGISGGFGSAFTAQGMTMFKIKASVGPFN